MGIETDDSPVASRTSSIRDDEPSFLRGARVYHEGFFRFLDTFSVEASKLGMDPEDIKRSRQDDRVLELAHQKGKDALEKL